MARMVLDDETKLDKDAAIYSKRTEEDEKELRKNLTREQKFQYFSDYYLPKILVGLVVLAFLAWLGKDFFMPKKEVVLYVAVVDDVLGNVAVEELQNDLGELYGIDPENQEVVVNAGFSSNSMDSMTQLTTYIYAGEVDVVVTSGEEFETLAKSGHFAEYREDTITKVYGDYDEENRIYVKVENMAGEEPGEGEATEEEAKEVNCGIGLEGSRRLKELGSMVSEPCAGIVVSAPNKENAAKFITYMMGE